MFFSKKFKNMMIIAIFFAIIFTFINENYVNCQTKTPQPIVENTVSKKQILKSEDNSFNFENTEKTDFTNNNNHYRGPGIIHVFISLLTVIFLIIISAILYARFNKINLQSLFAGKLEELDKNKINILSSVGLGSGQSLHLVKINNKKLIIGSCPNNVNLLGEIEDNEDILDKNTSAS